MQKIKKTGEKGEKWDHILWEDLKGHYQARKSPEANIQKIVSI
jgi:hypothetical protein